MDKCSEIKRYFYPYLDGELGIKETLLVQGHLEECYECKRIVEIEKAFLMKIKGLKISTSPGFEERIKEGLNKRCKSIPSHRSFIAAGFILFLFIAGSALFYLVNNKKGMPDIASASVTEHLSYLRGTLPLDITASNPEEISRWFRKKIDFNLLFPKIASKEITLVGGRLAILNGKRAAYTVYRIRESTISLLVTYNEKVDGEFYHVETIKDIPFYFYNIRGFNIITWRHGGVAYSLVSDLPQKGKQSCLICHEKGGGLTNIHEFFGEKSLSNQ